MGVRATWLADAARLTGYPVNEIAGWRGRGHGDFRVIEGVVEHHTADGPTGIYPSLGVVRDGRAGLAGPLANYGLGRDGTIFVIADGVAWHAGASRWAGYTDLNDEYIGIEAESTGTRDDWTPAQRDAYPRLVAAALFYIHRGADRACGHKECATPDGRKIDPAFWDLDVMRGQVGWYLADPLGRIPRFANPAPPPAVVAVPPHHEEDAMYIKCKPDATKPDVLVGILSGSLLMGLGTQGEKDSADLAIKAGAPVQWVEKFTWDALDKASHRVHDNPRPVSVDLTEQTAAIKGAVVEAIAEGISLSVHLGDSDPATPAV